MRFWRSLFGNKYGDDDWVDYYFMHEWFHHPTNGGTGWDDGNPFREHDAVDSLFDADQGDLFDDHDDFSDE